MPGRGSLHLTMFVLLGCLATHYFLWDVSSLICGEVYLCLWQVFLWLLPRLLRFSYREGPGGWRLYRAPSFLVALAFRSQNWFYLFDDRRVVVAEIGSMATDETVEHYMERSHLRRTFIRVTSVIAFLTGLPHVLFLAIVYDLWSFFLPFPEGGEEGLVLCWGRDLVDCGEAGFARHEGRRVTNVLSPGEGDLLCLPKEELYLLKEAGGGGGGGLAIPLSKGRPATSPEEECVVCRDYGRDYCCLPCGHYCLCGECAPNLKLCPKCACPVTNFQRVWA